MWTKQLTRLFVLPISVCLLMGLLFLWATLYWNYSNLWADLPIEAGVDVFFCEAAKMEGAIRQPINTWTNLPYLFLGLLFFRQGISDSVRGKRSSYNLLTTFPIYTFVYSALCIYLFVSSTWFHASLTKIAQQLDMSAVYGLILFFCFYNLHRAYNLTHFSKSNQGSSWLTYKFLIVFGIFTFVLSTFKWQLDTFITIPSMLLILLLTALYLEYCWPNRTNKYWLLCSSIAMLIGIGFYALDVNKIFCNQNTLFQPHAIWHLFAAISSLSFYLYIRSEDKPEKWCLLWG